MWSAAAIQNTMKEDRADDPVVLNRRQTEWWKEIKGHHLLLMIRHFSSSTDM